MAQCLYLIIILLSKRCLGNVKFVRHQSGMTLEPLNKSHETHTKRVISWILSGPTRDLWVTWAD